MRLGSKALVRPRLLLASSLHRWNDVRIYHKQARSLVPEYDVTVMGVTSPGRAIDGISVIELPVPRSSFGRFMNAVRIFKTGVFGGARMVHFHDPELIWIGLVLKLFGKRVVYDVHEDLQAVVQIRSWIPHPLKNIIGFLAHSVELLGQWSFDGLILAEDSYLNNFSRNDRIVVVRNFVRVSDQPLKIDIGKKNVFYAGSVTIARGVGDLLKAVALLQKNEKNIGAIIAGNLPASESEAITQLISTLPNPEAIQLVGYTDFDDLPSLALRCRIATVPLRQAENYDRSIPTKILDYMNWGMPFVYSKLELTDELFGDHCGGIGYEPGNVDELARAITLIMTNSKLHSRLRGEAREKVAYFNWEGEEGKLLSLFQEISSFDRI